jgi:hypothetical protein
MIGKIVEVEGISGLYVVVGIDSREDAGSTCYNREYSIIPYDTTIDEFNVDLAKTVKIQVKFATTDKLTVRAGKKPYDKIGFSKIKGVELVYFERLWESTPGR